MKFLRDRYRNPNSLHDLLEPEGAVRATMEGYNSGEGRLESMGDELAAHADFVTSLVMKLHEKGVLADDDICALVSHTRASDELVAKLEERARMPRS